MKDSQDWLVVVTGLYADYYANKITLGELSDGVNSIVREHFLKEALEMINNMEYDDEDFTITPVLTKLEGKFNDKYKEK